MTNEEFSNIFTTLLNSYGSQAEFGDEASKREIVLDEYEKSVLLTQAQDLIVKSYFDRTLNPQGQGFDDTPRRQVDFSSLIKVSELEALPSQGDTFDKRGILFMLPRKKDKHGQEIPNTTDVLFILNEKLLVNADSVAQGYWWKNPDVSITGAYTDAIAQTLDHCEDSADAVAHGWSYDTEGEKWTKPGMTDVPAPEADKETVAATLPKYSTVKEAEDDSWAYAKNRNASNKEYVIVPINYKEYDREMSKAYGQPLKKQAWRLFQNNTTGFDLQTELIPKHNIPDDEDTTLIYRIRYVRRPRPIVLEDMPNGLTIDGESTETSCELNPILHVDILNKAVELAYTTRGGGRREEKVEG